MFTNDWLFIWSGQKTHFCHQCSTNLLPHYYNHCVLMSWPSLLSALVPIHCVHYTVETVELLASLYYRIVSIWYKCSTYLISSHHHKFSHVIILPSARQTIIDCHHQSSFMIGLLHWFRVTLLFQIHCRVIFPFMVTLFF